MISATLFYSILINAGLAVRVGDLFLSCLRIDPVSVLGKQRSDHPADIVRKVCQAQRRPLGRPFVHFRMVADDATAKVSLRRSLSRNVDGNPSRPKFLAICRDSTTTAPFIDA